MRKQQRKRRAGEKQQRGQGTGAGVAREDTSTQKRSLDESTRLWQSERDSGVSEDSAYEASGAATGGGVDTPTAVEKSTEAAVRKRKPIDQGSSAYTGGGADNGTDL